MSTAPQAVSVARELEGICGAEFVSLDEAARRARAIDGVVPQAVVVPGSPEEVAAVLKLACERDLVVVPCGGFTRQQIGRIPPRVDIVLDTTRMSAVQYYEPGDLTIGVQAGAKLAHVQAELRQHGQMLPIDAPSAPNATLAGLVVSAASGPLRQGYGTVRDFCLGVQFATADGKVAKAGGRVVKNVAGYDVTKLMVGSYGTLAIITAVNLRVFPRPRQTRTFTAQFHTFEDALFARDQILLRSPLTPIAVEIVSPEAERMLMPQFARQAWALVFRAGGSDNVLARYRHELGTMITWETEHEGEERLWTATADFPDTVFARSPRTAVLRVAVPAQILVRVLHAAEASAGAYGFTFACAGRAISPLWLAFTPTHDAPSYDDLIAAVRHAAGRDGSAVVTHCPTEVKRTIDVWGGTANDLESLRLVKRTLDPRDVLNRGRFLL